MDFLNRQTLLIGQEATELLKNKRVAILGLGGVGGAALEGVVRSGVGTVLVWDNDLVEQSNFNRQLLATANTLQKPKTLAAKERILSINPNCIVFTRNSFYSKEENFILEEFLPDFTIDCIDTVTSKLDFMEFVYCNNLQAVSCLGTGNRLDPFSFHTSPIEETAGCGCALARVIRRELKKRGVSGSKVIYSTAPVISTAVAESENGRHPPGSISFVPPVAGFQAAGVCINTLLNQLSEE